MKHALFTACVLACFASPALALCKYKAPDGSWTFGHTCASMSEQEIQGSANRVINRNEALKKPDEGIEARRLRGYDYSTTTHSGMRIRMVEPSKGPPEQEFTSQ